MLHCCFSLIVTLPYLLALKCLSVYRPYIKDAQKILTRAREYGNPRIAQSKLNFLHLAIIDGSITTDSAISRLADDCCDRVRSGEKLYIHCWGGHGRTGTLVSELLATAASHEPAVGVASYAQLESVLRLSW